MSNEYVNLYLDKLVSKPAPKPKPKIELYRKVDEASEPELVLVVDKTKGSVIRREISVVDYQVQLGFVQNKKRLASDKENPKTVIPEYIPEDVEEMQLNEHGLNKSVKIPFAKADAEEEDEKADAKEEADEEDEKEEADEEDEKEPEKEEKEEADDKEEKEDDEKEENDKAKEDEKEEPKAKKPRKKKGIEVDTQVPTTDEIDGVPIDTRLPKSEPLDKILIKAPTYYMSNRKLYNQKLADLFRPFGKEILDDKGQVSCDSGSSTSGPSSYGPSSYGQRELFIHQRIVREYLNIYTPYRGLLLYHGLGSGKTCTSIAIAEGAKTHKRVFVLTPASLKTNFFSELKKCGDPLYKKNQYWEFVSTEGRPEYVHLLSQSLAISKETVLKHKGAWLQDIRKKEPNFGDLTGPQQKTLDDQINEMIRSKYVDINYNGINEKRLNALVAKYSNPQASAEHKNPFDHSVVLVDEVHNLVSRIVNNLRNKTSVASRLYKYLLSAQDVRIVFMTGTPMVNYPNEIGVLFNMLRGYIKTWKYTVKDLTKERVVQMLSKERLNTYDYIDYSNDVLTITRNPWGFVNITGTMPKAPVTEPVKTRVTFFEKQIRENIGEKLNTQLLESEKPKPKSRTKKNLTGQALTGQDLTVGQDLTGQALTVGQDLTGQDLKGGKRRTKKLYPKDLVETDTYEIKHGILKLPKRKPVEISNTISQQMEQERQMERENAGLDMYHHGGFDDLLVGGAPIVNESYKGVRLDEQGNLSDEDFNQAVLQVLAKNSITIQGDVSISLHKCLPDTVDDFNELFLDMDSLTIKRIDVLQKRVVGLTSYFRSAQESLLPSFVLSTDTINPNYHPVLVEMSDHQFSRYSVARTEEINKEPKKPSNKKADENKKLLKIASSYRVFSRAACNFAFPDEIERPVPSHDKEITASDLDNMPDELENDLAETDANQAIAQVSQEYAAKIQAVLDQLARERDTYLSKSALAKYSPKFLRILENLSDPENKGLHLIYSTFRTLEGIGILKLVLEANGFAEFKLKKSGDTWSIQNPDAGPGDKTKPQFVLYTGTESAEEREMIRHIYKSNWDLIPANLSNELKTIHENNFYGEIIKTIMITSSGAEGINLENTRFVHIVEPYWHMVRVDQVVGRARRICSHKNLPESLRTIKVFLYMCTFSQKQKTGRDNVGIMLRDTSRLATVKNAKTGETSITTDQSLYEIAVIKNNLTKQLLNSIKESSIDCALYDNSKEGLVCYNYGFARTNEFSSFPTYEEDKEVREGTDVKQLRAKIEEKIVNDVSYAYNPITTELYDLAAYKKKPKKVVVVGKLGRDARGREIVI